MVKRTLIQILKQIICIGMVIIVILPILLTLFAALKTKTAINTTSPLAFPVLHPAPAVRLLYANGNSSEFVDSTLQ